MFSDSALSMDRRSEEETWPWAVVAAAAEGGRSAPLADEEAGRLGVCRRGWGRRREPRSSGKDWIG